MENTKNIEPGNASSSAAPSTGGSNGTGGGELQLTAALVKMLQQILSVLEKQSNNNAQNSLYQANISEVNMKAAKSSIDQIDEALHAYEREAAAAALAGMFGQIFGYVNSALMVVASLGILAPAAVAIMGANATYAALGGFSDKGVLSKYISITKNVVEPFMDTVGKYVLDPIGGTDYFEKNPELLRGIGDLYAVIGTAILAGAASSTATMSTATSLIEPAEVEMTTFSSNMPEVESIGSQAATSQVRTQAVQQAAKGAETMVGVGSAISGLAQSNALNNFVLGIVNFVPNTSKEKKKEVADYLSMALTIVAAIVGCIVTYKSVSADQIEAMMGPNPNQRLTTLRKAMVVLAAAAALGEAGAQTGQGVILCKEANTLYKEAKLNANMAMINGSSAMVQQMAQNTQSTSKSTTDSIGLLMQESAQFADAQREASKVLMAVAG